MMRRVEPSVLPSEPGLPPPQIDNPTTAQRHTLVKYALVKARRGEDFNNIIGLLNPPRDITEIAPPGFFKGKKVGIIGGGVAGLSAAFELKKLGFDITVFDALKDRIGGRVYTYYFDEHSYGELGAMRIPSSHETVWHYINLFGLNTRPFIQNNENALIYVRNTRVKNDRYGKNVMEKIYPKFPLTSWERRTPWTELVDYGLSTLLRRLHPFIRREILQFKPFYYPQINFLDALSIRRTLEIMGLSQGAINLIGSISPLAGSFFYNSYIELLQEDYPVDFTYLYEIVGGLVNLPLAFHRHLLSEANTGYRNIPQNALGNVTWKGGTWVTGIYGLKEENKVTLKFTDTNFETYEHESFDYIVCAIPFSTLRTVDIEPLFYPRKMQAIREVNYSTALKSIFLCDESFWLKGGKNERILGGGSYTDLPISSIWYPSNIKSKVLMASYNFNQDSIRIGNLPIERRFDEIKQQVAEVHGFPKEYLDSIVKDHHTIHWNTEESFRGAFCYFAPEQKRVFSYAMKVPEYNNRIFFAGEHISPKHAWIQGGLQTGMEAANDLVLSCLRKRHL